MSEILGDIFGAGITAASNIGSAVYGNENALYREQLARTENFRYNERAADNADARTRALYMDLYSPQAQLEQLKAAGLSPSMFYGAGGGVSGQTGAQGAGTSGIMGQTYGMNPIDLANFGKTLAETKLLKAQENNVNADTDRINGDNERGQAEIQKLINENKIAGLDYEYKEFENALKQMELSQAGELYNDQIENYKNQCKYLEHMVTSAAAKAEIDEKSKNDVIAYLKERTINLLADTLLKRAQKGLVNEQIQLTKEQVLDLANQITNRDKNTQINEESLKAQITQWGIENGLKQEQIKKVYTAMLINAGANALGSIVDIATFASGLGGAVKVLGL